MIVVDSSGWVEYLCDGDLADEYAAFVEDPEQIVTPTIVLYEVYKITKRERTEEEALVAIGGQVIMSHEGRRIMSESLFLSSSSAHHLLRLGSGP